MESIDLQVLRLAREWLGQAHRVLLATVVSTWGSSPRPPGAMLAIRDDGRVVGSVSGGCIEDDLIRRVSANGIADLPPQQVCYGVSADEARRFGLPCGGTLRLVIEALGPDSGVDALLEAVTHRQRVRRVLDLRTGHASVEATDREEGLHLDEERLVTVHGPRYRLLLIGAGQLSRFLAMIAVGLDFDVTVCDPRTEYTDTWDVADSTLVRTMPDDTVIAMRPDAHTAIIALTHDPKLDDMALLEALDSEAFYVAALGSRRNNEARRARLKEHFDISSSGLARLHGPAGLYIGSRTPTEIAVSIAAELVAARNGVLDPRNGVAAQKNRIARCATADA